MITESTNKRIYGLDILRAIAILLVIHVHTYFFLDFPFFTFSDGVSIFFVLSGFLIGQILLKSINNSSFNIYDVWHFWIRRWFRTLPAYFFVITVLIAIHILLNKEMNISHFCAHYFFIQDTSFEALYPESWSLKIEEWFYLVVPFLLYLSLKLFKADKNKIVLFWIISFIIVGTVMRSYFSASVFGVTSWLINVRFSLPARIDSIMYGMFGAFLAFHKYKIWDRKNLLFFIGVFIYIVTAINSNIRFNWFTQYFQISFESLGALFLLPKLCSLREGKGYVYRFFTFVSTISYSMYLINATPFKMFLKSARVKLFMLDAFGDFYKSAEFILYLVWCFLGAYILYRLIELPMMKLRDSIVWSKINLNKKYATAELSVNEIQKK